MTNDSRKVDEHRSRANLNIFRFARARMQTCDLKVTSAFSGKFIIFLPEFHLLYIFWGCWPLFNWAAILDSMRDVSIFRKSGVPANIRTWDCCVRSAGAISLLFFPFIYSRTYIDLQLGILCPQSTGTKLFFGIGLSRPLLDYFFHFSSRILRLQFINFSMVNDDTKQELQWKNMHYSTLFYYTLLEKARHPVQMYSQ